MKTKRFATLEEVREFAAAVDLAAGLPAYGVDIGGGRHVDRELSRTLYVSEYVVDAKAAEGEQYAYLVTADVEVHDGKVVPTDKGDVLVAVSESLDDSPTKTDIRV